MQHLSEYSYTRKDFKVEWFSRTGPGGQRRNKVQCCCWITHLPSGIYSQSTSYASRNANYSAAFRNVVEELQVWIRNQISAKYPAAPKSDEVIRTYHHVENRIKDHASGLMTNFDLDKIDEHIIARLNNS